MSARQLLPRIAVALVLGAAIVWMLFNRDRLDMAAIETWLAGLGWWAPAVFVMLYAAAVVVFSPAWFWALAGGALFGPVLGTACNIVAATIGATLAFLVARYLASDWIARRTGGWLKRLIEGVEAEGWRFVAFVRLVPLFPFNLLNYALGLTKIRISHYVLASAVCMLPGTIAYTYLGYAGREAVAGSEGLLQKGLLALGLLATVAFFLPILVRRLRGGGPAWIEAEALKRRLDRGDDVLVVDVRGADEFTGPLGHIPGARNIAIDQLAGRLDELAEHKARDLALVCLTDMRSAKAAGLLKQAGFSSVAVMRGGMRQWHEQGFAAEAADPASS